MKRLLVAMFGVLFLSAVFSAGQQVKELVPPITDVGVPTFADDVLPIMRAQCVACHRPDGAGPFSLCAYEDVRKRAEQIVEVTSSRYMPPWLPNRSHFRFANERRLSSEELATLVKWNETGRQRGGESKLPSLQEPIPQWHRGEPDLVLTLKERFALRPDGPDVFWNFVLPSEIASTKYVETVEIVPGNRRAVHHVIGLYDRMGTARRKDAEDENVGFPGMEYGQAEIPAGQSMLWSPGKVPSPGRRGIAWQIDSRTDIVLQMHMLPTGKTEWIQPQIGLYFADSPASLHPISVMLEASSIDIPAGEKAYEITDEIKLPVNIRLLSVYPHAHYLATRVVCDATLPDGTKQRLLKIDDWDFNWQDEYQFQEPVELPAGAVVRMRFTYDNSAENIRNPNSPPRRVVLGNQSTDEMGSVLLQMLTASEEDRRLLDESRWEQTLLSMPHHPTANQNLGNICESRGDHRKALEHYRRVLQVAPDDCVAHDNVACALSALGNDKTAETHFRQAMKLNPKFALGHSHWGASLMRQNRVSEAIEKFTVALELWPEFPEARLNLGEAELLRGNIPRATEHFRLATKHSPSYALAHFNLGTVLMNTQQFVEATVCFRQAIEVDDRFAEAFNNLGIVLFQQGELTEAAEQFRRSIELDPAYENPKQNLRTVEQRLNKDIAN